MKLPGQAKQLAMKAPCAGGDPEISSTMNARRARSPPLSEDGVGNASPPLYCIRIFFKQ